jgi:hypothetical protein
MGGQACVLYGAAEFSRDLDLLILVDPDNFERLRIALDELEAEPIAVPVTQPPLNAECLLRGHAFHFRCRRPDVAGLRIDLMAALRDGSTFHDLWERRTTLEIEGQTFELLSVEDLVRAKQTQRDKDWPMVARLVERRYLALDSAVPERELNFLLRELRTPELLIEAVQRFPNVAASVVRPAIQAALAGDADAVERELKLEEAALRARDRAYWEPLKRELEQFRHELRQQSTPANATEASDPPPQAEPESP